VNLKEGGKMLCKGIFHIVDYRGRGLGIAGLIAGCGKRAFTLIQIWGSLVTSVHIVAGRGLRGFLWGRVLEVRNFDSLRMLLRTESALLTDNSLSWTTF
jgi:hypothetical protein